MARLISKFSKHIEDHEISTVNAVINTYTVSDIAGRAVNKFKRNKVPGNLKRGGKTLYKALFISIMAV